MDRHSQAFSAEKFPAGEVHTNIQNIPPALWEELFGPSPENYNYVKAYSETLRDQFEFFFLELKREEQTVCIAPCFLMNYSLLTTIEGPLKKLLTWLNRKWPHLFSFKMLFCGSPAGQGTLGLRDRTVPGLLEILTSEMDRLARQTGACMITFKDFSPRFASFLNPASGMKFHRIPSYPFVERSIRFKTFDEYLATLSRATRKGIRRKFKDKEFYKNLKMTVVSDCSPYLDEIQRLYESTYRKSDVTFEKVNREFFLKVSETNPNEAKYFLWHLNGHLVAFDLCMVSNGILIDEYIGMEYPVAYQYNLYYVTFRDIINWCIENGVTTYRSGALNYDPKKCLDLEFIPMTNYVRHVHPVLNFLLRPLALFLNPENFDPVLKKLKKQKINGPKVSQEAED